MNKSILISLSFISACAHKKVADNGDGRHFNALVSRVTDEIKKSDPFWAPYFNVEADLDKFGDYPSPAYQKRAKEILLGALRDLTAINPAALSEGDLLTYRLFKEDMTVSLKQYDFPFEMLAFNQMDNRLHSYLDDSSQTLTSFPFDSVKHYEDFVKRSEGFPDYVKNQSTLLREGIRRGITQNCVAARKTPSSYQDGLIAEVEKNPFYRPVLFMPKNFSQADRERLTAEFRTMVQSRIIPSFQAFDKFFRSEYIPHCRKNFGYGGLPNGKKWYRYKILQSTNLELSPEELHKRGLSEVARIQSEIVKIQKALGFKGSYKAFLKSLNEPKYYFTSAKEMFDAFLKVKEAVGKKVPQFFALTPKSDYEIVEASNPQDAAGSYFMPTEMVPHGRFIVNTKNLNSVARYGITTLSLHESIPGHHFQLALQYEMKDRLSEYQRKVYGSNSFVEGWALYAESLGYEMDFYADDLQRLGNLNDEMLRAVRLVVDTGIHAYGWSQKQTIAYMSRYLASDAKGIETEANRYSVWPGQALGYKVGQMKILELRKWAQAELGEKFNYKDFHKAVIGNGTVSLQVLETQVKDWVAKAQ